MIRGLTIDRRAFLGAASMAALGACAGTRGAAPQAGLPALSNPLVRQRADAHIFRHGDGAYYMTASVPEYDRLIVRRAATITGLADAPEAVVWRRPAQGKLGGHIWAPELHAIDGRWHIYFAAGDADEPFHIRTYVMRCDGADAMDSPWSLLGQFEAPWDSFNLDSTLFEHRGTRYICWAQHEPGIATNSNLYLAPLATPTTLAGAPTRLTIPTLPWEIRGFKVAEAPAILARGGRLFLAYSASATDARYCLGMLTADADADIMSADAWSKSPAPVFESSEITQVYGPGHNSFTVDEQGRDILVYHGRDYRDIDGDPLFDPNRHTRVQRLYYRADGTPDFGIPVGNGAVPDRFSPADDASIFLWHEGDAVLIGNAPLPATQFRQVPGRAGGGAISLEPITAPGRLVCRASDGSAALADAGTASAGACSFRLIADTTNGDSVKIMLADGSGLTLQRAEGRAGFGPQGAGGTTFLRT